MPQNELTESAPISAATVTQPIPVDALRSPWATRAELALMAGGALLGVVVLAAAVIYLAVLA